MSWEEFWEEFSKDYDIWNMGLEEYNLIKRRARKIYDEMMVRR
jgi:hypothetical protein